MKLSQHSWAELSEQLPRYLIQYPCCLRHPDHPDIMVGAQADTQWHWQRLDWHPDLLVGVRDPQQLSAITQLLRCLFDSILESESLSTALVTSYSDFAVLDELGRELPACHDAHSVGHLCARLITARLPGMGCLIISDKGRYKPLTSWGGAHQAGVVSSEIDAIKEYGHTRLTDRAAVPHTLLSLEEREQNPQGSTLTIPLHGPGGFRGAILLAHQLVQPFTSHAAKLLTVVAGQLAAYLYQLEQAARIRQAEVLQHEVQLAGTIQQQFLPQETPPLEHYETAGRLQTARHVGGDYYDHIYDGHFITLAVADVSGHNVAAALTMSMLRTALHALLPAHTDPAQLCSALNSLICPDLIRTQHFITLTIVQIDTTTHTCRVVNAGGPPVLLRRASTTIESYSATGPILGLFEEQHFQAHEVTMEPGDTWFLYSDGIIEAMSPEGDLFEQDRLKACLKPHFDHPSTIIDNILERVARFHEGEAEDDITLLAMRRLQDEATN